MQALTLLLLALTALAAATPLSPPLTCRVAECDPNPMNNKCHITTSCINTEPNSQLHCACRDGYKSAAADNDTRKHYRTKFAGQESRVFVAPGVKCDTLCDEWWLGPQACQEVKVMAECS